MDNESFGRREESELIIKFGDPSHSNLLQSRFCERRNVEIETFFTVFAKKYLKNLSTNSNGNLTFIANRKPYQSKLYKLYPRSNNNKIEFILEFSVVQFSTLLLPRASFLNNDEMGNPIYFKNFGPCIQISKSQARLKPTTQLVYYNCVLEKDGQKVVITTCLPVDSTFAEAALSLPGSREENF